MIGKRLPILFFLTTTVLVAILLSSHVIEETAAFSFPFLWGKKATTGKDSEGTTTTKRGLLLGLMDTAFKFPGTVIKRVVSLIPIPTAAYPRLRYVCENQELYKECMISAKAITKEEADTFQSIMIRELACPMPKDDKKMTTVIDNLKSIQEVDDVLTHFKLKIPAFLKCSNAKKGKKSKP